MPIIVLGPAARLGAFTASRLVRLHRKPLDVMIFFLPTFDLSTVYQNTNLERYLETSRRMATYFLNNIPGDGIVPWSAENVGNISVSADSSAQGL